MFRISCSSGTLEMATHGQFHGLWGCERLPCANAFTLVYEEFLVVLRMVRAEKVWGTTRNCRLGFGSARHFLLRELGHAHP